MQHHTWVNNFCKGMGHMASSNKMWCSCEICSHVRLSEWHFIHLYTMGAVSPSSKQQNPCLVFLISFWITSHPKICTCFSVNFQCFLHWPWYPNSKCVHVLGISHMHWLNHFYCFIALLTHKGNAGSSCRPFLIVYEVNFEHSLFISYKVICTGREVDPG
jgi:hypothetical protein